MTALAISSPSRLHFGLLGWGGSSGRQFGGIGLMIDRPGLVLSATPADRWSAIGPMADRALAVAQRVTSRLMEQGVAAPPLRIEVIEAPRSHVGLGSGTQMALGVARIVAESSGLGPIAATRLAEWSGRGRRSGIGLHGFDLGGLIVDGGRRIETGTPPLLARLDFPVEWSILVVIPREPPGLHGPDEIAAFARLPPVSSATTDRLCGLTLLGLLPSVVERDLDGFGSALVEIQRIVGNQFAAEQSGGIFASPESSRIATWLEAEGLHGVGQSSWGPAIYGFSNASAEDRSCLLQSLRDRHDLGANDAFWTMANNRGAIWKSASDLTADDPG